MPGMPGTGSETTYQFFADRGFGKPASKAGGDLSAVRHLASCCDLRLGVLIAGLLPCFPIGFIGVPRHSHHL